MGTTFYKITYDAIVDAYEDYNIVVWQALKNYGWDAFDISKYLYGSQMFDDVLYVCDTDGVDIEVEDTGGFGDNGLLNPEEALAAVGPESLQEYIKVPDDDEIRQLVTPYDLDEGESDLDEIATQLLQQGYSFNEIVTAAADAQLIEV